MELNNSPELSPVPPSSPPIMQSNEKGNKANKIAKTTGIINLSAISILVLLL